MIFNYIPMELFSLIFAFISETDLHNFMLTSTVATKVSRVYRLTYDITDATIKKKVLSLSRLFTDSNFNQKVLEASLITACKVGDTKIVKYIAKKLQITPDQKVLEKCMIYAVKGGYVDCMFLINGMDEGNSIDCKTFEVCMINERYEEIFDLLLAFGGGDNNDLYYALESAIINNRTPIVGDILDMIKTGDGGEYHEETYQAIFIELVPKINKKEILKTFFNIFKNKEDFDDVIYDSACHVLASIAKNVFLPEQNIFDIYAKYLYCFVSTKQYLAFIGEIINYGDGLKDYLMDVGISKETFSQNIAKYFDIDPSDVLNLFK